MFTSHGLRIVADDGLDEQCNLYFLVDFFDSFVVNREQVRVRVQSSKILVSGRARRRASALSATAGQQRALRPALHLRGAGRGAEHSAQGAQPVRQVPGLHLRERGGG